jgi:hypothetical protein
VQLYGTGLNEEIGYNRGNFAAGIYFLRIENSIPVKIIKQ